MQLVNTEPKAFMGTGAVASVGHLRKGLKHLRKVGKDECAWEIGKEAREDEVGGLVRVFTVGGWPYPLNILLLESFPSSRFFTASV